MKKLFVILVLMVVVLTTTNSVLAFGLQPNVTFVTLPSDSVEIGHYFARYCRSGVVWTDEGSITIGWFGNLSGDVKIHMTYIQPDTLCQPGHIVLAAKPGYHWQMEEGNFWNDGRDGFVLVSD